MAFHHVAFATRDLAATHAFYTEAMGFELVKVEAIATPGGGWARHAFYDTGDGMVAVWDLHDDAEVPEDFDPAISTGLGLPAYVNHLAFAVADRDGLDAARDRWLALGHDVLELDHGWCTSVYADDPNGILVEWCLTTRTLTAEDRAEALALLAADHPAIDHKPPGAVAYEAAAVGARP